jgi:C4-dicarboxylate-specific signal transduction histidine kinase
MASMGEMIENIAHQWRQPLSQINSSVLLLDGILKQKNVEDKRIEEKLLEIESLTQYMSNTIDDFKNFFEQNKKLVSFSVDEVFDTVFSIISSLLGKNNIYVEYINDTKFTLKGYPNELQQVILVIMNNAIDSLVNRKIVEPKIVISILSEKEFLKIQIEDNGRGIDENMIDQVFYPYFTTKQESDGNGVGLYMSKMIIEESMHGTLSVENTEKGACFIIDIPQKLISYET